MKKPLIQIVSYLFIAVIVIISTCSSCSVMKTVKYKSDYATIVPTNEDLLTPNPYDYLVLSYDYPYVEVLLPDSTTKYLYYPTTEIKGNGYIIADR